MRVYVVGDVHGQLAKLRAAHDRIAEDRMRCGDLRAPVVHLGDLCDRGPDTSGVIQFLLDGRGAGALWRVVKGNHDAIFMDFIADPDEAGPHWLSGNMGGTETLASYGVDGVGHRPVHEVWRQTRDRVPAAHISFMQSLDLYVETEDLILVHAGIRPGVPMSRQTENDLIWIRAPFLNDTSDHGKLVVHGHTPVDTPMHCGNHINLDTGAGYGRPLTAAVFEGRQCFVLTDQGRQSLEPYGAH